MINNSSLDRWKRLETKSLDQQFVNEIIHGLNCSPFEASAVVPAILRIRASWDQKSLCPLIINDLNIYFTQNTKKNQNRSRDWRVCIR